MRGCVARRAAAIGSLILPVVAPAEAHLPGSGGKTGSGKPINIISPDTLTKGKIAAAARCEFIRLGQPDDDALLARAEQDRHSIRSIESVSFSAAYCTTNDTMVAIRIPHMRRSDIREAAEAHRGRPRPNDDVVGNSRPANRSRTAVTRCFA
jgi:hypothetical protein